MRVSIPTGNRSQAEYLFEPIVGNGHHWGLGIGLTGHRLIWHDYDRSQCVNIYADLNVTHLFNTHQRRSFDLKKNGRLSRYMLIEEMGKSIVGGLNFDSVPVNDQYLGRLVPAINKTTFDVDIHIAAQVEFVIKCLYQHNNFNVEMGYNLWGRTAERIKSRETLPSNSFAIKGDAHVYGYDENFIDLDHFFAINATENCATIHKGQGVGNRDKNRNGNVDNASLIGFEDRLLVVNGESADIVNINGSNQALLLEDCDIENRSGLSPGVISHTLFLNLNYDWKTENNTVPFFGGGMSVELNGAGGKKYAVIPLWSTWIKGGVCW